MEASCIRHPPPCGDEKRRVHADAPKAQSAWHRDSVSPTLPCASPTVATFCPPKAEILLRLLPSLTRMPGVTAAEDV
jgi:hypothetical protein